MLELSKNELSSLERSKNEMERELRDKIHFLKQALVKQEEGVMSKILDGIGKKYERREPERLQRDGISGSEDILKRVELQTSKMRLRRAEILKGLGVVDKGVDKVGRKSIAEQIDQVLGDGGLREEQKNKNWGRKIEQKEIKENIVKKKILDDEYDNKFGDEDKKKSEKAPFNTFGRDDKFDENLSKKSSSRTKFDQKENERNFIEKSNSNPYEKNSFEKEEKSIDKFIPDTFEKEPSEFEDQNDDLKDNFSDIGFDQSAESVDNKQNQNYQKENHEPEIEHKEKTESFNDFGDFGEDLNERFEDNILKKEKSASKEEIVRQPTEPKVAADDGIEDLEDEFADLDDLDDFDF